MHHHEINTKSNPIIMANQREANGGGGAGSATEKIVRPISSNPFNRQFSGNISQQTGVVN